MTCPSAASAAAANPTSSATCRHSQSNYSSAARYLQWADAATTSAVVTLSRRLATHRIGWLLALRAGELAEAAHDAVGRLEAAGATEIWLGPLADSAVAQVARDTLGGEPDEALRQVLARTDGQPILLTELLRGLLEEHLVSVADGTARLTPGGGLPRRFVDSVAGQLARLTAAARDAVEMASVLGRTFSLEELAGLLGRPPLDLRGAIRETIAAGLLTEDGDRLRFRSANCAGGPAAPGPGVRPTPHHRQQVHAHRL